MSITEVTESLENMGPLSMIFFGIKTALLFGGIFCVWKGIIMLWEIRPIWKKKYTRIISARVVEVAEEHRSATLNVYYTPRFEFEGENGKPEYFAPPKPVRPCRLKYEDEVTLCVTPKRKFRAIRKKITLKPSLIYFIVGVVLILSQVIVLS